MARPEPCVLYSHSFVHPQLDEYVDEVLFSEPVIITACEFLEQNASASCSAVKIMGATSPPSFALEIFIQCEGEARFRRLCLPLLYSQSSSNVLEIEAIVTSHLVVRGSYRSLSMVIYGNTAEDLGQFNIEVDIDSSLTNTVNTSDESLEDLPSAFQPSALTIKELVYPLQIISQEVVLSELPLELRKFLQLAFKIMDSSNHEEAADKVICSLLSVSSNCLGLFTSYKMSVSEEPGLNAQERGVDAGILSDFDKELLDAARILKNYSEYSATEYSAEVLLESDADVPTSKELINHLYHCFDLRSSAFGYSHLSQTKNIVFWLSVARLLCSARESCSLFVSSGGIEHLMKMFSDKMKGSASLQLFLLGVIDQATQHSFGCEGFLGWWPRFEESPPAHTSDGYNQVLKLLLETQRHDVASFATRILHRVRFYEVACRYENSVLSILGDLSTLNQVANSNLGLLVTAKGHLQKLLKLLKSSGPIDDPSPLAVARRHLIIVDDFQLTFKATISLLNQSACPFLSSDIDSRLLSLLKERGFLPLSAALISAPGLRSEAGHALDSFLEVVLQIEEIILMLLFCRSGLNFLLHEPEVISTLLCALRGIEDNQKEASFSARYASVLISKGFFFPTREVGLIIEMHMRALCAFDRLCKLTPSTEEFLWVLWDLCRLSRSDCGRQVILVLVNFPEAINVLMSALNCGSQLDSASSNNGVSPLNLAIAHSAAEIFEVLVTDSSVTSLKSWIELANELHMALHSSSPSSNKKDAPARLLEWIDAGVVYHRNGVIGLLRYAAVLVSGGDVHVAANSILSSDMIDVANMVGDSSGSSDGNVIDNLIGKRITEKDFTGFVLRDSSTAQLATALRILAYLSDNQVVSAALYDEGAVMVVHAIIINCELMLERSSNVHDFLVDEGLEGSSTSDFLLERDREKCLFDLLISSLVLLINLMQRLKEAKEQHRNKNFMNALLKLHREVSSKLVSCAANFSKPYPEVALSIATVCSLLASALASWPVYGWTPSLAQFLLDNIHANSLLALGPKDTCSLFCLLNDLLPDEGIWRWKYGLPFLYPLRATSVGTLLGPEKEKQIKWHLMHGNVEKLLSHLSPKLEKLGEVILHCAISMSVVLQDFLRVFVIRMACMNLDYASLLVKPVIAWVTFCLSEPSTLSDVDVYKVNQMLQFLAALLEHPIAKPIFLREGGFQMLTKVLERCIGTVNYDTKPYSTVTTPTNTEFLLRNWCNPTFQSVSLISDCRTSYQHHRVYERDIPDSLTTEECCILLSYLLKFFLVLPFGSELLNCLSTFNEIVLSSEGQSALLSFVKNAQPSTSHDSENRKTNHDGLVDQALEWSGDPPLLSCWTTLLKSLNVMDAPVKQISSAIDKLASGLLQFCVDQESVSITRVSAIKFLFGIKDDSAVEGFVKESLKNLEELINFMGPETRNDASSNLSSMTHNILDTAKLLLLLLQNSSGDEVDATIAGDCISLPAPPFCSKISRLTDRSTERVENLSLEMFGDTFFWECPENLRNRLAQTGLSMKRKSLDGPSRHFRGENAAVEVASHGSVSKSTQAISTPTGLTRRDAFRQRKPNTSRPPSMHVDDYVARERNAEGTSSSNVIAVPRVGSSTGRPPSIHVDVFMARQADRQSTQGLPVSDTGGVKPAAQDDNVGAGKSSESWQLRSDLDDDLQGIDIVFDADEPDEPDGKLHFPQPDDNLQQSASVAIGLHSPHSMVEDTAGDANESSQFSRVGTPLASTIDENAPGDYPSRMPTSRMEISLNRQPGIPSDRKFTRANAFDPSPAAGGSGTASVRMNASSSQYPVDPRLPTISYPEKSIQHGGTTPLAPGMQGYYNQKIPSNQPAVPPMLPALSPSPHVMPQNRETLPSHQSSFAKTVPDGESPGFLVGKFQSDYVSAMGPSSTSFASGRPPSLPMPKSSTSPFIQTTGISEIQQSVIPPPPPSMQQLIFRPGSMPTGLHGAGLVLHHGDPSAASQNPPMSMPLVQPIQPLTQLQPLQPPLIPPPAHHLRPPIPASAQSEQQRISLFQGSLQIPSQSAQVLPQAQPSLSMFLQVPKPEHPSHALQLQHQTDIRVSRLPGEGVGVSQQQDPGMSLQEYFRSPEAIQYLLSDREKLCQLLEQHPKLLEMLQERLGQL